MSIRTLLPSDISQVLSINEESQPHVAALDAHELHRLLGISQDHLVAEQQGQVSGYALSFSRDSAYDGEEFLMFKKLVLEPFIYIDQVAILPSTQKSRLGQQLYGVLELLARTRGASSLCCEVNISPPNPGSRAFHNRMGFELIRPFMTGDGRSVELLQKPLPRMTYK